MAFPLVRRLCGFALTFGDHGGAVFLLPFVSGFCRFVIRRTRRDPADVIDDVIRNRLAVVRYGHAVETGEIFIVLAVNGDRPVGVYRVRGLMQFAVNLDSVPHKFPLLFGLSLLCSFRPCRRRRGGGRLAFPLVRRLCSFPFRLVRVGLFRRDPVQLFQPLFFLD